MRNVPRPGDTPLAMRSETARDRPPEEAAIDTSFARGLRLLLAVADRGEARADELATALEMPVSTVYRYLRTLAEFGFVDRRDGRFLLGQRLLIGSGSTVTSERLRRHAGPILRELAERTGETAIVVRRVATSAMLLAQHQGEHRLRAVFELEEPMPLHTGAIGEVLLAHAPDGLIEEVLALAGWTSELKARRRLRRIVADGGAVGLDPDAGLTVAAVPILAASGIVGALAVAGPDSRCDDRWAAAALGELRPAALRLAAEIEAEPDEAGAVG